MAIQLKSTAQTSEDVYKKMCIHGQSGVGKTMLAATLAGFKPLIILTEKTGDESLQVASIEAVFGKGKDDILYDMDIIEAYTAKEAEEAVQYAIDSEIHDVIIFDSGSKFSGIVLKNAKGNTADGRKAYGDHNSSMEDLVDELLFSDKHIIILAHTSRQEDSDTGEVLYFPSFEGKAFPEKFVYSMPHVLFMEDFMTDDGSSYKTLRAKKGDSNKRVKTRGNALSELNEPHLGRLLGKLIGQTPKKTNK